MAFADTLRDLLTGGPKKRLAALARAQEELRAAPSLAAELPPLAGVADPDARRHVARLHALAARTAGDAAAFADTLDAADDAVRAILVHELGNDRRARVTFEPLVRSELRHPSEDVRASAVYVYGQWGAAGGDAHAAAADLAACLADHRKSAYHRAVVSAMAEQTWRACVRATARREVFAQALEGVAAGDAKTRARVRAARGEMGQPASGAT